VARLTDDNNNRHSAARHPPGGREANRNPTAFEDLPIKKRGRFPSEPGPGIGIRVRALALRTAALWPLKKQVPGHRSQIEVDLSAKQTCFIWPASMRGVRHRI